MRDTRTRRLRRRLLARRERRPTRDTGWRPGPGTHGRPAPTFPRIARVSHRSGTAVYLDDAAGVRGRAHRARYHLPSHATSTRVTPSISSTTSAPYARDGVWKPAGAAPASARRARCTAVRAVSV